MNLNKKHQILLQKDAHSYFAELFERRRKTDNDVRCVIDSIKFTTVHFSDCDMTVTANGHDHEGVDHMAEKIYREICWSSGLTDTSKNHPVILLSSFYAFKVLKSYKMGIFIYLL